VEELVAAGVEEVIIVCQQDDVPTFERLFHQPDTHQNFSKLPAASRSAAKQVLDVGEKVRVLVQPAQEGFGHALYCAKEAVGDAPFLLLIGHHVYRSTTSTSVAAQLLEAFTEHQCSVVSLMQTHIDEVHHFGTVCGTWIRDPGGEGNTAGGAQHTNLVERTLGELGLSHYADRFAAERLLYSQLPALTNEELKDMGIPLGPRKMMLDAFAQLSEAPLQRRTPSADSTPSALRVHEVAEKPTKAYALEKLVMASPSLKRDTFLTMFGQYVLTPEIFRHL
jgi:UTP-glucose-1-phosphate uridylyltransferase